jgi:hypothetical protein
MITKDYRITMIKPRTKKIKQSRKSSIIKVQTSAEILNSISELI